MATVIKEPKKIAEALARFAIAYRKEQEELRKERELLETQFRNSKTKN